MRLVSQNFVGGTRKSDLAGLGRAETTNMFVEMTGEGYSSSIILRGMPGWSSVHSLNGVPRGIVRAPNNRLFYVMNDCLYCDGNWITNVSAGSAPVSMCITGGHTPYLLLADGTSLYALNTTVAYATMASNLKYIEVPPDPWLSTEEATVPGKPKKIVMYYEHPMLLLENTDRIYMGYQYPFEVDYSVGYYEGEKQISNFNFDDLFMLHWQNTDCTEMFPMGKWISADYSSDIATDMEVSQGKLIVGGSGSTQAFSYIAGDFVYGNVFSTNESQCSRIGMYNNSLLDVNNHICFCSNNGVYVDNIRVSDDFVDREIASGILSVSKIRWYSHMLYVIHMQNRTIAYDISTSSWITLMSNSNGVEGAFRYSHCIGDVAMCTNGVVQITENSYTEHDGSPIVKKRRGAIMMDNGKEIQIDRLQLLSNEGQWNGSARLTVYRDSVQSESCVIDLSTLGIYDTPFEFYDLGVARKFEIEFSCDANSKFSMYQMNLDVMETI